MVDEEPQRPRDTGVIERLLLGLLPEVLNCDVLEPAGGVLLALLGKECLRLRTRNRSDVHLPGEEGRPLRLRVFDVLQANAVEVRETRLPVVRVTAQRGRYVITRLQH